jgi:tetratricopeptide (TPR) repeat protein
LAKPGGIPFSGASGLLAALLVAYWLRGWGGRLVLPGWMLLPLWLFAEYVIVRGVWLDRVGDPPILAHATGLAVGVLAAVGVGMLSLERRLAERADPAQSASNPALALADRAIAEGQFEAAWSALSNAAAENPEDDELVQAWWKLACEQGRAGEVVGHILPRIAEELRGGDGEMAIEYWFEIVHHAPEVEVEARIAARLGEALIERGDSAGAREALRRAVADTQGLTTALAQRVVRSARELDPEIARTAAAIALKDAQLDPASREALGALLENGDPGAEPTPSPEDEVSDSVDPAPQILDLSDRIQPDDDEPAESPGEFAMLALEEEDPTIDEEGPELQEIEDAVSAELGLAEDEELTAPDEADEASPGFGTIDLSEIDPAALSIASPEDEIELAAAEPVEGEMSEPDDADDDDSSEDSGDSFQDDSEDLESLEPLELLSEEELESVAVEEESVDPDALSASNLAEEADAGGDGLAPGEIAENADEDETLSPSDEEDPIIELTEELLVVDDEPPAEPVLRSAKVLEGVPLGIGEEALEVEIDGRGVGRIPYSRIEALAVAAVSGLSARPVLVMDLVLNWKADPAEPLKLIRIKGNLFDPLSLAPEAESPLHALKEIIATIADRSGAECLPDSAAVAGDPFRRFQDLAQYEQAILGISS